jgi:ABC-type lipoprotein export system ATPase subunit
VAEQQPVIDIQDVTKTYTMGQLEVQALRGVSLQVRPGELMAIMGPSGSGKSTLMNILGALDTPTGGVYKLDGQDVGRMRGDRLPSRTCSAARWLIRWARPSCWAALPPSRCWWVASAS